DPSEWAGMYEYKKRHGDTYVNGPGDYGLLGTSVIGTLCGPEFCMVGIKPYGDRYAARCDLPLDGDDMGIVGVATHSDALEALARAVNSACVVGATSGLVTPADIAKCICVRSCFEGQHPFDVAHTLQQHLSGAEVGSLFGSIFHGLGKIASPIAHL